VKKATGAADLSELTAVVTGTAQGIGRAIAASIRHAGADVFEVDKDTVDLTDSTAVREFFASPPRGRHSRKRGSPSCYPQVVCAGRKANCAKGVRGSPAHQQSSRSRVKGT